MATKEFIQDRINSITEKITKRQSTINKKKALINKKQDKLKSLGYIYKAENMSDEVKSNSEAFWLWCDIDNLQDDIKSAERDVRDLNIALDEYTNDLKVREEKDNSRDVQIIIDFLNNWEQKTIKYYIKEKAMYDKALKEYHAILKTYIDWHNNESWKLRREDPEKFKEVYKQKNEEENDLKHKFIETWRHVTQFESSTKSWEENMKRLIAEEKNRKYDFIIEKTNAIVGQITDASNLKIGIDAELNGIIIGTRGKAKIQTIGAGGWNVQRYHFRTLIHEVK